MSQDDIAVSLRSSYDTATVIGKPAAYRQARYFNSTRHLIIIKNLTSL